MEDVFDFYNFINLTISEKEKLFEYKNNLKPSDNYDLKFNAHDFYVNDPVLEEIYNYIYDYKLNLEISLLDFGLLL